MGGFGNDAPPRRRRHEEDINLGVGVLILHIVIVGFQFAVSFLELVRDVFEKDKPQHDVLILGGVHVPAQDIRRRPDLLFEADVGCVVPITVCHMFLLLVHRCVPDCQSMNNSRFFFVLDGVHNVVYPDVQSLANLQKHICLDVLAPAEFGNGCGAYPRYSFQILFVHV